MLIILIKCKKNGYDLYLLKVGVYRKRFFTCVYMRDKITLYRAAKCIDAHTSIHFAVNLEMICQIKVWTTIREAVGLDIINFLQRT